MNSSDDASDPRPVTNLAGFRRRVVSIKRGKEVSRGTVVAVDPVSTSFILFHSDTRTCSLLPHVNLEDVSVMEDEEGSESDVEQLLRSKQDPAGTEEVSSVGARKSCLLAWLRENNLAVEERDAVLSVQDGIVLIRPPYTADSCDSTNEIVLDRIRSLVVASKDQ